MLFLWLRGIPEHILYVSGEAWGAIKTSTGRQVHRASLETVAWLVSILLQTRLWLLGHPLQQPGLHLSFTKMRAWGQMIFIKVQYPVVLRSHSPVDTGG